MPPASSPVVGGGVWDNMSAVIRRVRSCINLKECKHIHTDAYTHRYNNTHQAVKANRQTDMARPPNEQEQNTSAQFTLKVNWLWWEWREKKEERGVHTEEGRGWQRETWGQANQTYTRRKPKQYGIALVKIKTIWTKAETKDYSNLFSCIYVYSKDLQV